MSSPLVCGDVPTRWELPSNRLYLLQLTQRQFIHFKGPRAGKSSPTLPRSPAQRRYGYHALEDHLHALASVRKGHFPFTALHWGRLEQILLLSSHYWERVASSKGCFWNLLQLAQQAGISHLVAYFTDVHLNSCTSQGKTLAKRAGKIWALRKGRGDCVCPCRQSLFSPAGSDAGRSHASISWTQLMPAICNLWAQVINRSCAFLILYSHFLWDRINIAHSKVLLLT